MAPPERHEQVNLLNAHTFAIYFIDSRDSLQLGSCSDKAEKGP